MNPESAKIYIIGAGIAGLIAARTLSEKGYHPVILEATNTPGGRVKTDKEGGANYDHGFQVLLTAYPEAQKHLDYTELDLHTFRPGALIFKNGEKHRIGDPIRDLSALWPTLKARVGTLRDKWKIFRLSAALKRKSLDAIFASEEKTTLQYLQEYGFSEQMIADFFKPFFSGIFLETELRTSSRMFEFTFKMFSEGYAALPDAGIGAISAQLAESLKHCQFHYLEPVAFVSEDRVVLESGETLEADAVISTVPIDPDSGKIRLDRLQWKRCDNLYFTVAEQTLPEGIIGLLADENTLVNNLHHPFGLCANGNPILSVTVVKEHKLPLEELTAKVRGELKERCGIEVLELLHHYPIERALPELKDLAIESDAGRSRLKGRVFAAGDYVLNGSLNAAMASGEQAAEALIESLDG